MTINRFCKLIYNGIWYGRVRMYCIFMWYAYAYYVYVHMCVIPLSNGYGHCESIVQAKGCSFTIFQTKKACANTHLLPLQ